MNSDRYGHFIKIKLSLWMIVALSTVAWIRLSHPAEDMNCDLGWMRLFPYISNFSSELCGRTNTIYPIIFYFTLSAFLVLLFDLLEIVYIVNQYDRIHAGWPELFLSIIYIYALYDWFFLDGIDFKFENSPGFLHHGEFFSPIFYAIFFPSISSFIFSGINALGRSKSHEGIE